MSKLELRWLGHACFALKYKDFTVVFDPFEDNYVRGFGSLDVAADLVLCSHFHNDHGAAYVVQPLEGHENPFQVTGIQTFHDPEGGKLRGENVIHILEADGFKVAHLGDLGLEKVAELSDFLVQIEEYNEYPGNTITVDKKTEAQVAVLKFIPN